MDFPSVALLTDFGERDGFVGVLKGVMLSRLDQAVPLVDISHHIAPQDIWQGAWVLGSAYPFFAAKTVFVAIVDPHVGSDDQAALIAYWPEREQVFIAPDNGLLTSVLQAAGPALQVSDIRRSDLYRKGTLSPQGRSQTFHGRDVYAPIVALSVNALLSGSLKSFLACFGPCATPPVILETQAPFRERQASQFLLKGTVVAVDVYGNVITNLPNDWVQVGQQVAWTNAMGQAQVVPVVATYNAASAGQAGLKLLPSSGGTLEVAIECGNAQQLMGLKAGDAIVLRVLG